MNLVRLSFSAFSIAVVLSGCGNEPPIDARGQALSSAAGSVSNALEASCASGAVLSTIDLSRGENRDAVDAAATVLNDLFGACLHVTTDAAPAVGLTASFAGAGGCSIPLTGFNLGGALGVHFANNAGKTTLSIQFRKLHLIEAFLDGELDLTSTGDSLSYVASDLRINVPNHDVLLSGQGTLSSVRFHTAVEFDGSGFIVEDGVSFAFRADRVYRKLGDCYPDKGTITLSEMDGGEGSSLTIRFKDDSHDHGTVWLDYQGHTRELTLPRRSCTAN